MQAPFPAALAARTAALGWGAAWPPAGSFQPAPVGQAAAAGAPQAVLSLELAWEADGVLAALSGDAEPGSWPSSSADLDWSTPQPLSLESSFAATAGEEAGEDVDEDWGLPLLDGGSLAML
jgi:hypothetical protein